MCYVLLKFKKLSPHKNGVHQSAPQKLKICNVFLFKFTSMGNLNLFLKESFQKEAKIYKLSI